MQGIYVPSGRALEYSLLACNLYTGCSHGCSYCFAPGCLHKTRAAFHTNVVPRTGIIEQLRKDAPKYAGTDKRVLLCFHCDPYSLEAAASGVTRQALEILREYDIPWQILTKGGLRACADFDLYRPGIDAFATTLTFVVTTESAEFEPGAALPADRVAAIVEAHRRGIETWVSLEPVIHPADALYWIERLSECVTLFKVGKLNHDKAAEARIDWSGFGAEAVSLLKTLQKKYYIKDDLAKHLPGVTFTNTDTRKVVRT